MTELVPLSPLISLYPVQSEMPKSIGPRLGLAHIPSSAFGDGSHPTTRLCAGAVDVLCRTQAIAALLDVGTGTGVLARIARARGVKFVAGTDIDPAALRAAEQNAALDERNAALEERNAALDEQNAALDEHKSTIEFANVPPDHWGARFDLVVANILEGPLRDLAPALIRALAPGGQLLLSGFTRLQSPGLRLLYENSGLKPRSESEMSGWVLLHLQRDA